MRIVELITRILLGLLFLIFGCNGFRSFLPAPSEPLQGSAGEFLRALSESHYYLVISGFQVVAGSLLLVNRFVGLALAILAPIIVNILCFHVFMMPSGLPGAIAVAGIWAFLAYRHRHSFAPLLVSSSTASTDAGCISGSGMEDV
jgi:putative oxidoreductase